MNFFRFLTEIRNSHLRKQILVEKSSDEQVLRALKEIAMNVVHGNVPLDKKQKSKLQRHGDTLRSLSRINLNKRPRRRKLINQSAGFLPILIPSLLSILSTIATQKLKE